MSEIKHTPLPWKIEGKSYYSRDIERHVVDVRLTMFSSAMVAGDTQEQAEANAALIAAAPDMYEALKEAQKTLAMMISPDAIKQTTVLNAYAAAVEAEYKARQALAKAKGETE